MNEDVLLGRITIEHRLIDGHEGYHWDTNGLSILTALGLIDVVKAKILQGV